MERENKLTDVPQTLSTASEVIETAECKTSVENATPTNADNANVPMKLYLTQLGAQSLFSAAKWARFLSIVNMVLLGLMALAGIINIISGFLSIFVTFRHVIIGAVYVICAIISFVSAWSLNGFANKAIMSYKAKDSEALQESMVKMAFTFKYVGIMTVVYFIFVVIMFVAIGLFYSAAYL